MSVGNKFNHLKLSTEFLNIAQENPKKITIKDNRFVTQMVPSEKGYI
jgi:hypothetical protein